MTVWTLVSLNELQVWLHKRNLPAARTLSPIEEGVEDSVYRVTLVDGTQACLRLFERTEPQGPLSLAVCLAQSGLPTCPPIADATGAVLAPLNGKPASLFPWVEGAWVERPSLQQIESIGTFLGRMAKEGPAHCQTWTRTNPRGWPWFEETAAKLMPILDKATATELADEMAVQRAFWQSAEGRALPRGPIHADIFRNNVMFHPDGSLGAVIDWGFCASDGSLLYELAIVANDWCLQENTVRLDPQKEAALLRGRESALALTPEEREAWPLALRLAALRFYLSRLHDFYLPRDPNGKALDPLHFHALLRERRKA